MSLFGDAIEQDIEVNTDDALLFESPQSMPFCLGHNQAEQYFLRAYEQDTMPHSLVFSGPQGIGKATFAFRLARFLFKHGLKDSDQGGLFADAPLPSPESMDVDQNDTVFRQILSGAYPDLLYIERAYDAKKNTRKAMVDVDSVRKINTFMRKTSSYGGWRIVIIDDADTMNRNAQNAVLKILEEPPKNAMIILIAHRMGTFLPTIRSRVNVVNFSPLKDATMRDLLSQAKAQNTSDVVLKFAQGRLSRALDFQTENFQDIFEAIHAIYQQDNRDVVSYHKFADFIGRAGSHDDFSLFATILLRLFETDILNMAVQQDSTSRRLDQYDEVRELIERTQQSNLDKKQCVLQICMLLKRS